MQFVDSQLEPLDDFGGFLRRSVEECIIGVEGQVNVPGSGEVVDVDIQKRSDN